LDVTSSDLLTLILVAEICDIVKRVEVEIRVESIIPINKMILKGIKAGAVVVMD
jgi:hypothetical protein